MGKGVFRSMNTQHIALRAGRKWICQIWDQATSWSGPLCKLSASAWLCITAYRRVLLANNFKCDNILLACTFHLPKVGSIRVQEQFLGGLLLGLWLQYLSSPRGSRFGFYLLAMPAGKSANTIVVALKELALVPHTLSNALEKSNINRSVYVL